MSTKFDLYTGHVIYERICCANLQKLQVELENRASLLDYVDKTGEDLVKKGGDGEEKAQKLKAILNQLNAKWKLADEGINNRILRISNVIKDLSEYQLLIRSLSNWISEVEAYLASEVPAIGDTDLLRAQLAESEGSLADLNTLGRNLDSIRSSNALLSAAADDVFKEHLAAELSDVMSAWDSVSNKCHKHVDKVRDLLAVSEQLISRMGEMEKWLEKVSTGHMNEQYVADSLTALETFVLRFEVRKRAVNIVIFILKF